MFIFANMELIETTLLPLSAIEPNHGQIDGLPKNPRVLRDAKFDALKKSITDNPEMLALRELLVFKHGEKYVIIGGNMRYRALKDLKYKDAPCKVIPADTPVETLRAYTIKDNGDFGEWDFDTSKRKFEAAYKASNYDTGFKNLTNRAAQHTVTHELAHATWTSSYKSPKHISAGKEIKALYKKWSTDTKKKGYGSYSKRNVDEFWAETVTKGIHGKSDKYTRKAISIAKEYKL